MFDEEALDSLELTARNAEPGPWFAGPVDESEDADSEGYSISIGPFDLVERYGSTSAKHHRGSTIMEVWGGNYDAESNAAFIQSFNPEVVLRLIAQARLAPKNEDDIRRSDIGRMIVAIRAMREAFGLSTEDFTALVRP